MYGFEHMLFENEKLVYSGQAQPLLIGKQTHTLIFEAVEKPQDVKKLAIALRDRLNN